MDENGYPTEETLKTIRDWDFKDMIGFFRFIASIWYYPDRARFYSGKDCLGHQVKKFYLSTGGWSGNEEIISAMQDNSIFMFTWCVQKRGGHFWFELPRLISPQRKKGI